MYINLYITLILAASFHVHKPKYLSLFSYVTKVSFFLFLDLNTPLAKRTFPDTSLEV